MLVLSRKIGEIIVIGNSIKITVLGYDRGFVKLGIEAPRSIPVHRKEIYDKIIDINRQASTTEIEAIKDAIQSSGLRLSLQQNLRKRGIGSSELPKVLQNGSNSAANASSTNEDT